MPKKKETQKKEKPEVSEVTEKERRFNFNRGRIKSFFTVQTAIITLLLIMVGSQYLQTKKIFGDFSFLEGRDTSLLTEIGHLSEDLTEVREFLRLPTRSYDVEDVGEDSDKNTDEVQIAMFRYVESLANQEKIAAASEKNKGYIEALTQNEEFLTLAEEKGVNIGEAVDSENKYSLVLASKNGGEVEFYVDKESGDLFRSSVLEEKEMDFDSVGQFVNDAKGFVEKDFAAVAEVASKIEAKKAEVAEVLLSENVVNKVDELGISIEAEPKKSDMNYVYSVLNQSGELIGEILIDFKDQSFRLVDIKQENMEVTASDLDTALVPFLEKLDTLTFIERQVVEAKAAVELTIGDKGFQLLLKDAGISIVQKAREDNIRYYYDIKDADGNVISSIVVEKSTGVINIVEPDGTNAENLLTFQPESKKKTLDIPDVVPEYSKDNLSDDSSFNVLIAGKHGNLIDTMIFAHVDEVRREVRMISIPRDLFYNGRKINAYGYFYGMPELKRALSDMTGYELDKYILIDMYAFIDVIDIVGGIDVTLEHSVIDPTYRTVDNGVVGTLHYEPGDYHLGGKESLRLARSRHTSSDFARAARQQLILEALQEKARNFGFGDADTIYEIAKVVLSKTDTDIELDEALAYYFRYQNYDIVSNNVMSSGNVLYVPPYTTVEDCQARIAVAEAAGQPTPGCMNENHAYTLLPRNNNWNVVKWYFRENFEGSGV